MTARATPERLRQIGDEVLAARANGEPWKVLSRRYSYGIARLKILQKEARRRFAEKTYMPDEGTLYVGYSHHND